jgi:antitoxin component HigA of HigAB toxin-antitoxin module
MLRRLAQRIRQTLRNIQLIGAGPSASDLGRLLGNRGLGSLLLTGKRGLSKTHIRKLSEHFKVPANYFL